MELNKRNKIRIEISHQFSSSFDMTIYNFDSFVMRYYLSTCVVYGLKEINCESSFKAKNRFVTSLTLAIESVTLDLITSTKPQKDGKFIYKLF